MAALDSELGTSEETMLAMKTWSSASRNGQTVALVLLHKRQRQGLAVQDEEAVHGNWVGRRGGICGKERLTVACVEYICVESNWALGLEV